ncbi:MAG: hypothetical protein QMD65_02445 [Patescibacteria group bacterium]|nr:hypothetical protein [Patescibacteria group bacterium]
MKNKTIGNFNKDLINSGANPAHAFRRRLTFKLIILGGVFIITVVVLFFVSSLVKKQVDRIQILRAENKWLLQSLDAIASLKLDNIKAQNFLKDLNSALVVTLDVPSRVVPAIESRIVARGLVKTKFELSNEIPASDSNLGSIEFFLQAEGALADIVGFLSDIESGKIMLKFVSFDISPIADANKNILNLKGLIYTRK